MLPALARRGRSGTTLVALTKAADKGDGAPLILVRVREPLAVLPGS